MTFADPRGFLYRSLDPDEAKRLARRHLAGSLINTSLIAFRDFSSL